MTRELRAVEHGEDCSCLRCRGFEKGNGAAVRHGGYALLGIGERAQQIADSIRPTQPAYSVADEPVLLLLATTLARIERGQAAIEAVDAASDPLGGYLAASDSPTLAPNLSALRNDLRAWINTARRLANDLGLTPTSRARLGLDIAAAQRIGSELVERYGGRVE
ncbi:MAG: hypothetical protein ACRDL7_03055 [Gaiellaceae bacterium]